MKQTICLFGASIPYKSHSIWEKNSFGFHQCQQWNVMNLLSDFKLDTKWCNLCKNCGEQELKCLWQIKILNKNEKKYIVWMKKRKKETRRRRLKSKWTSFIANTFSSWAKAQNVAKLTQFRRIFTNKIIFLIWWFRRTRFFFQPIRLIRRNLLERINLNVKSKFVLSVGSI